MNVITNFYIVFKMPFKWYTQDSMHWHCKIDLNFISWHHHYSCSYLTDNSWYLRAFMYCMYVRRPRGRKALLIGLPSKNKGFELNWIEK